MKVAIDCRALRKSPSGIPNFIVSAINGLAALQPQSEFYLLTNEPFNQELEKTLEIKENIKIIISPLFVCNQISFLWLLFKVNGILKKIKPDLYWGPAFLLPFNLPTGIKSLVTVHDLVFKEYKGTMSTINKLFFSILHDRSINKADKIWVNSEYTGQNLKRYFPEKANKSIYKGFFINTNIFKTITISEDQKQKLLAKYNLQDKFLMFVGTLEPRKNLNFLLSLMPELALQGYSLLIIGAQGWGETNISHIINEKSYPKDKTTFAGFVTTRELVELYNIAHIYVSTSLNEGFGMPQLEAMACGCPVVSPHNSAMIEVVDGAGETVKSWLKEDWLHTINQVSNNRAKYIKAGFNRVKSYNRETVLRNLLDFISS